MSGRRAGAPATRRRAPDALNGGYMAGRLTTKLSLEAAASSANADAAREAMARGVRASGRQHGAVAPQGRRFAARRRGSRTRPAGKLLMVARKSGPWRPAAARERRRGGTEDLHGHVQSAK